MNRGRPSSRTVSRNGPTANDAFAYNKRRELISAVVSDIALGYGYDKAPDGCKGAWTNCAASLPRRGEGAMGRARVNIGNRRNAIEGQDYAIYAANSLNQYTDISGAEGGESYDFVPTYDNAGNQTLVKTSTGIWTVSYNAENRPVTFTRSEGDGTETRISCAYDSMGRRATKLVETVATAEDGTETKTVVLHERYIYRGYLQIAACDLTAEGSPCLWHILWDPAQPVATRPLAIRMGDAWHAYGWDLTKNVCELFDSSGSLSTTYTYTPYGEVSVSGAVSQSPQGLGGESDKPERFAPQGRAAARAAVSQPIQWSSEFYDAELCMTYYNYRNYIHENGKWAQFDSMSATNNLYLYCSNAPLYAIDFLGLRLIEEYHPREKAPKGFAYTGPRDLDKVMAQDLKVHYLCKTPDNTSDIRPKKMEIVVTGVEAPDWIIELYWPEEGKKYRGYTLNGIKTIIAHEKKRLEVYKKAYNMYIDVVIENVKKIYFYLGKFFSE